MLTLLAILFVLTVWCYLGWIYAEVVGLPCHWDKPTHRYTALAFCLIPGIIAISIESIVHLMRGDWERVKEGFAGLIAYVLELITGERHG